MEAIEAISELLVYSKSVNVVTTASSWVYALTPHPVYEFDKKQAEAIVTIGGHREAFTLLYISPSLY